MSFKTAPHSTYMFHAAIIYILYTESSVSYRCVLVRFFLSASFRWLVFLNGVRMDAIYFIQSLFEWKRNLVDTAEF
jgi:hypothetical protein